MKPTPVKAGLSDKSIGALAYFTPVMAVFFLAIRRYNKRPYVRFHAWQSLVFNVYAIFFGYVLVLILRSTTFLGPRVLMSLLCLVGLLLFLVWLWCLIGAWNGKRVKLPVIGDWAEKQGYMSPAGRERNPTTSNGRHGAPIAVVA